MLYAFSFGALTAKTSAIALCVLPWQNLSQNAVFAVAGVAGFEPTHARIKILCLTAWRHPIVILGRVTSSLPVLLPLLPSKKSLRTGVAQNASRIFVWRVNSKNKCNRALRFALAKPKPKRSFCCGWGGRIRTYAMLESESNALPLGDTPSNVLNMGHRHRSLKEQIFWGDRRESNS